MVHWLFMESLHNTADRGTYLYIYICSDVYFVLTCVEYNVQEKDFDVDTNNSTSNQI